MDHDPRALAAGTEIAGYRIVRKLGAGGFGITYEAHNEITKRRVAIKELYPRASVTRSRTM